MKITELTSTDLLERPTKDERSVDEGLHEGITSSVAYTERESKYSEDGSRVVLNVGVEITDKSEKKATLYIAPNYSWSSKGNMVKLLEKLDVLPEPGQSLKLSELVGIPVQVIVKNVEKDGVRYSNIVSIERIEDRSIAKSRELDDSLVDKQGDLEKEIDSMLLEDSNEEVIDLNSIDIDDLLGD